jgi:ABC-type transport system substrate-binding protein
MNRAVNRKEFIASIFEGTGEAVSVWGYHRSTAGWNQAWADKFDANYGYDPVRAKKLLEEAGYPNGFRFKMIVTQLPGASEMIPAAEAAALYFQKIGLQPEMVSLEWAKVRDTYRAKKTHNWVYPIRGAFRPPHITLRFYNISGKEGFISSYEDKVIDEKYEQLLQTIDPTERARIQREIGDIKFKQYAEIPITWIPAQIVMNPKVVAEYTFSGVVNGFFTNFEYAKAAK